MSRKGAPLHELAPRILHEAYEQGGVLSYSGLGLLTGLRSVSGAARLQAKYRELYPDDVLPHSGTIFDLGRTLTHKQQAGILEAQWLLEQEIARRINHHPSAVARYLTDNARVLELWQEGKDAKMISALGTTSSPASRAESSSSTSPSIRRRRRRRRTGRR